MKAIIFTGIFVILNTICFGQVKQLTPAPSSVWKSLPQFEVAEQAYKHHWYAIENENNPAYWQNVNTGTLIICLKSGSSIESINETIEKHRLQQTGKSMNPDALNFYSYKLTDSGKRKILQIIYELKNSYNNIAYAEPESIIESDRCFSNDPHNYPNSGWKQWSINTTMIDSAWCTVYVGGWGQWIGIIDNACDYTHPDIGTIYGYDFADGDADVIPDWTGSQTHGTHVMGIAGANINNSIGMAGVSNDTVYFAKAVKNGATSFDNTAIINAINDMALRPKVRVINMSFSSDIPNASIEAACNYAWSNNKLLIATAGNKAVSTPRYPSGYSSVISVGSVGVDIPTGTVTFSSAFSNYGSKQELTAPGGNGDGSEYDIWSLLPGGGYGRDAGTSMSAPMVAGLASLIFDVQPSLTNAQARWVLQHSVFDLGATGWDAYYGYGVICGWCAIYNAIHYTSVLETNSSSEKSTQSIYPNPNDGKFIVKIDSDDELDTQIAIYNTVGKVVWNTGTPVGENSIAVDLSSQPAGLYYVKIKNGIREEVKMISVVK